MNGERGGGGESRLRASKRRDGRRTGVGASGDRAAGPASGGWEIGLRTRADGPGITWGLGLMDRTGASDPVLGPAQARLVVTTNPS